MKLYIVYFRTMQDSPDVKIRCATTNEALAKDEYKKAKKEKREWMKDVSEDSGDWAEACMKSFNIKKERKPGDKIFVLVENVWCECVDTTIKPFIYQEDAEGQWKTSKENLLNEFPDLTPFNEYESIDEATHLEDPSVMVDVFLYIEEVTLK